MDGNTITTIRLCQEKNNLKCVKLRYIAIWLTEQYSARLNFTTLHPSEYHLNFTRLHHRGAYQPRFSCGKVIHRFAELEAS